MLIIICSAVHGKHENNFLYTQCLNLPFAILEEHTVLRKPHSDYLGRFFKSIFTKHGGKGRVTFRFEKLVQVLVHDSASSFAIYIVSFRYSNGY